MTRAYRTLPNDTRGIVTMSLGHVRGRVLDFGAGTAKYRRIFDGRAESYTSFDMVAGPNIDVVGDVLKPPFPDGSFDTVICTQVMEHVREPWTMVAEIARILAPGGTCILTTPFLLPFHADPYDYFRYTVEGGSSLFTRAGMTIVDSAKYGGWNMVLAEMLKFTICNHYVHKNPGFLRRNIFRVLYRCLSALSRRTDQDTHIYANIYVVARKPS